MKESNLPKEILRAWFDTVLNPLITELDNVLYTLEKDELNWRFEYQDFTQVKRFRFLIYAKYHPNFEQIIRKFNFLARYENEYDRKRDELNNSFVNLFNSLINIEEMEIILKDRIIELNKKNQITDENKEYLLETQPVKWIADYLVNNIVELDNNNILKPVWDNYREEFVKFLEKSELKKQTTIKNKNMIEFERIVRQIFEKLIDFRNKLSYNNDVPIVTDTIAV